MSPRGWVPITVTVNLRLGLDWRYGPAKLLHTHAHTHHHHHHLEIYSAPITFAAIGAVQKSYEQQQTLTNVKSKGKIMGF